MAAATAGKATATRWREKAAVADVEGLKALFLDKAFVSCFVVRCFILLLESKNGHVSATELSQHKAVILFHVQSQFLSSLLI